MSRRRVVITGMGVVTPLGHSVEDLYSAACEGKNGVGPITRFDARTFPTTFAAEVKDYDLGRFLPDAGAGRTAASTPSSPSAPPSRRSRTPACSTRGGVDRTRCGVYLGCGEGIHDFPNLITTIARSYRPERRAIEAAAFFRDGLTLLPRPEGDRAGDAHDAGPPGRDVRPRRAELQLPDGLRRQSSQAIGEATAIIRDGDADVMLSGGSHSMIHPLGVTGFNLLTALSQRNADPPKASRPFDKTRDGFVLGEGRGHGRAGGAGTREARGAPIYAEVAGYGSTGDAFRVTDSHDEGRGAIACMKAAPGRRRPGRPSRSATSTPTAPARRSTTAPRRWRSRRCSASTPTSCRSRRARA